ncbi:MAG: InlB B-repeat-containing protein [Eubacteriales bacterium]
MEEKKQLFGKGIYGSKDVPIRLLDGFIAIVIVMILVLVVWFATRGGFVIAYDTNGGSEIASTKSEYGVLLEEPETPIKAGYTFQGWITSIDETIGTIWDFQVDVVEDEMTLYALWEPAKMVVKFDLDGGFLVEEEESYEIMVTYSHTYGELPVPSKDGFEFNGWIYSGEVIQSDTIVSVTGEHVLTATWKE